MMLGHFSNLLLREFFTFAYLLVSIARVHRLTTQQAAATTLGACILTASDPELHLGEIRGCTMTSHIYSINLSMEYH